MFYNLVIMYINLLNFRQHLLNLFSTVKYFVTVNYFSNFFVNILVFHPLQDFFISLAVLFLFVFFFMHVHLIYSNQLLQSNISSNRYFMSLINHLFTKTIFTGKVKYSFTVPACG